MYYLFSGNFDPVPVFVASLSRGTIPYELSVLLYNLTAQTSEMHPPSRGTMSAQYDTKLAAALQSVYVASFYDVGVYPLTLPQ